MTAETVFDLAQQTMVVMLRIGLPGMGAALVVGLTISLFQALTQIQELTLTFVPKLVAISLAIVIAAPFMLETLTGFSEELFARIASLP